MKNYFPDWEFQKKGLPKTLNTSQIIMKVNLRDKILNPIRDESKTPCNLTDCYRTMAKYIRLQKKYNPSQTSDHFWGQSIPTKGYKRRVYGPYYSYSVGAVDFQANKLESVFENVLDLIGRKKINPGQIILEYGKRLPWIHISNPAILIYSRQFIANLAMQSNRILISHDNGKSYEKISLKWRYKKWV